jgi:hypothetical protein
MRSPKNVSRAAVSRTAVRISTDAARPGAFELVNGKRPNGSAPHAISRLTPRKRPRGHARRRRAWAALGNRGSGAHGSSGSADARPGRGSPRIGLIVAPLESTGGTTSFDAAMPVSDAEFKAMDLPDEVRQELMRTGFIELDTRGLPGPARYLHGDWIAELSGDTVRVRRPQ